MERRGFFKVLALGLGSVIFSNKVEAIENRIKDKEAKENKPLRVDISFDNAPFEFLGDLDDIKLEDSFLTITVRNQPEKIGHRLTTTLRKSEEVRLFFNTIIFKGKLTDVCHVMSGYLLTLDLDTKERIILERNYVI